MTIPAANIEKLEKEVEAHCQVYELARREEEPPEKMDVYQASLTAAREALAHPEKQDHQS